MSRHPYLLAVVGSGLLAGCQSCHWSREGKDAAASHAGASPPVGTQVAALELPGGAPGVGFDDLRYSPALDEVLVPAGRSGRLDLIDRASRKVLEVPGFSEAATYAGGHDDGVTSADSGPGVLYATDRTTQRLAVIDPVSRTILESVALAAHPDYVRFVEPTHEVWVTEPDADQLEIFSVDGNGRHPTHAANAAVPGGPESLVVDASRSRVYTHLWRGKTVSVDIHSHAIVARWDNGCRSSRGIALDEDHGLLIAACAEGKAAVLDVRDGHRVSELETGGGVDIIDFDPRARHLYIPSGKAGTLVVAALSEGGRLTALGTVPTTLGAHCVVSDRHGVAYVCDAAHGRLLVVRDGL